MDYRSLTVFIFFNNFKEGVVMESINNPTRGLGDSDIKISINEESPAITHQRNTRLQNAITKINSILSDNLPLIKVTGSRLQKNIATPPPVEKTISQINPESIAQNVKSTSPRKTAYPQKGNEAIVITGDDLANRKAERKKEAETEKPPELMDTGGVKNRKTKRKKGTKTVKPPELPDTAGVKNRKAEKKVKSKISD